jgi:hypothetical protein
MQDAVRTIGHLLEHHPTTRRVAGNAAGNAVRSSDPTACSWCLIGASMAVAIRLGNQYTAQSIQDAIRGYLSPGKTAYLVDAWENEKTDADRLTLARKLQQYV